MGRDLGIFAGCTRRLGVSLEDEFKMLKEAGFTCYDVGNAYRAQDVIEIGEKVGLKIASLHGPFMPKGLYCNDVWKSGTNGDTMVKLYKRAIDTAAECNIPNVVIHFLANYAAPEINDLGLARMDDVVEYAINKGVVLAFENLVRIGALAYAADRYEKIPNVRFCYDFGHAHCYPGYQNAPTLQVLDIMTDRVVTTHLHDNMGYTGTVTEKPKKDPDYHQLPFDGNCDYRKAMSKLDEYGYRGALVLELGSGVRPEMSAEDFIHLAYERVKRVSDLSKLEFED
jgi:sugar phosphate isomerase/epimerase